jgi:hypothetical protein
MAIFPGSPKFLGRNLPRTKKIYTVDGLPKPPMTFRRAIDAAFKALESRGEGIIRDDAGTVAARLTSKGWVDGYDVEMAVYVTAVLEHMLEMQQYRPQKTKE